MIRQQLRRRRLTIWTGVAVLLVIAWFCYKPVGRAIKHWQSRRLAHSANRLIEEHRFDEAAKKARDAIQLSPGEVEAWRAIAGLLSRTGHPVESLEWWKKVADASKLTVNDRREYAQSASAAGNDSTAARQLGQLLAKPNPETATLLAMAEEKRRLGDNTGARDYAERVIYDAKAQPEDVFSASLIVLSVMPFNSPEYAETWRRLIDVARDPQHPASLAALVALARAAPPTFSPRPGAGLPFSATLSSSALNLQMTWTEIADRIESHPKAGIVEKLFALKLRADQEPSRREEYVDQAVKHFGKAGDKDLAVLAPWLISMKRYESVLQLLPLEKAAMRKDLFLPYLDALAGLGRWQEVISLLTGDRFPLPQELQHTYLAIARGKTGESMAAHNEWQRALDAADRADKLFALAGYAENNGAVEMADAALAKASGLAPADRVAYEERIRLARMIGQTDRAHDVAVEITRQWPEDENARLDEAYFRLLLGMPDADAQLVEQNATAAALSDPDNWKVRAVLALSRLRLGHPAQALDAFNTPRPPTAVKPPPAVVVHAAVLAANNMKEAAQKEAGSLAIEPLLPQERALLSGL